jgi:hypothetical protein
MRDLHSNIKVSPGIDPGAILTDGTSTSATIDTAGYDSLEWLIVSGALTDGTFTATMYHGDASNMSDEAAVTSTDHILGTVSSFVGATSADDSATKRFGYRGPKRYVRIKVVRASCSTGGYLCAVAIQGHPKSAPVS